MAEDGTVRLRLVGFSVSLLRDRGVRVDKVERRYTGNQLMSTLNCKNSPRVNITHRNVEF